MKKIAITGLSGVIGGVLTEKLSKSSTITELYHANPLVGLPKQYTHERFDLLDKENINARLTQVMPDVLVHMAAITHIDACEKDKQNGKNGVVWKTNVESVKEIAAFSAKHSIPLIFTSTECVFDGKKEFFSENDTTNPINWYGETKRAAEDILLSSGAPVTIIRSVVAYHMHDNNKTIYSMFLNSLRDKDELRVVHDQRFTPTYTYDIVHAITVALKKNLSGILHVSPQESLSPFEFAKLIAERNGIPLHKIKEATLESFYGSERASLRLRNSCLQGKESNKKLGFVPEVPQSVLLKKDLHTA